MGNLRCNLQDEMMSENGHDRRLMDIAVESLRVAGVSRPHPKLVRVGATAIFQDCEAGLIVRIGGELAESQRNIRVTQAMSQVGVPVLQPILTEPLIMQGLCVTVWPLVVGGLRPTSQAIGKIARILHDQASELSSALKKAGVSLNCFVEEELRRIQKRIMKADDAGIFSRKTLMSFSQKVEDIALKLAEHSSDNNVVVHGDLYPGNTVADGEKIWLIDLDMVSFGPPVVDIVPELVRERRFPGLGASYNQFVEGYGDEPTDAITLQLFTKLREITIVSWIAELAVRKPTVMNEARRRLYTISEDLEEEPWTEV